MSRLSCFFLKSAYVRSASQTSHSDRAQFAHVEELNPRSQNATSTTEIDTLLLHQKLKSIDVYRRLSANPKIARVVTHEIAG